MVKIFWNWIAIVEPCEYIKNKLIGYFKVENFVLKVLCELFPKYLKNK
jgi:hypothetical protein